MEKKKEDFLLGIMAKQEISARKAIFLPLTLIIDGKECCVNTPILFRRTVLCSTYVAFTLPHLLVHAARHTMLDLPICLPKHVL